MTLITPSPCPPRLGVTSPKDLCVAILPMLVTTCPVVFLTFTLIIIAPTVPFLSTTTSSTYLPSSSTFSTTRLSSSSYFTTTTSSGYLPLYWFLSLFRSSRKPITFHSYTFFFSLLLLRDALEGTDLAYLLAGLEVPEGRDKGALGDDDDGVDSWPGNCFLDFRASARSRHLAPETSKH